MATKILISYDGTDNDNDALQLGALLAGAETALAVAYVRHAKEAQTALERLADEEADALLERGARGLGGRDVARHVIVSGSTADGLSRLATKEEADLIVFGSEYRTATDHVVPQASARRLLDGGSVAVAIAPAGFAARTQFRIRTIAAIDEDHDRCVRATAETLAGRLGAVVAEGPGADFDVIVVGSKPGTVPGRVTISAAAEYLIELSRCPVLVLPREVVVDLGA